MTGPTMRLPSVLLSTALLLVACGKDGTQPNAVGDDGKPLEELPAPQGKRGGVTGMPDRPGPGPVGPPTPEAAAVPLDTEGNPLLPEAVPGETSPAAADTSGETSPAEATAVIRDYYAAINRGDFASAHALWADGGRASGQSAQQFAAGFTDTTGVSVELMPPTRVDAAAGSRVVEVPVALTATLRDGSQRRYVGAYVVRQADAGDEQHAWRIASADIREVQP